MFIASTMPQDSGLSRNIWGEMAQHYRFLVLCFINHSSETGMEIGTLSSIGHHQKAEDINSLRYIITKMKK